MTFIASQHVPTHRGSRCRRLFVTGTDTGVGKTRVACALAAAWRRDGRRVAVLKPIETGCAENHDGRLIAADAARLAAAAGILESALVCPNRYAAPAAPAVAAELAGRPVDLDAIDAAAAALSADADVLLTEGAGGLLVPIDRSSTMADLAARLGARLVIVARASLGTINHTLLTVEAARRRDLPIAGVILNRVLAPLGVDEAATPSMIALLAGVAILGTLPHRSGDPTTDELADDANRHIDLARLWEAL
jgi:dethiobiotin synthetase